MKIRTSSSSFADWDREVLTHLRVRVPWYYRPIIWWDGLWLRFDYWLRRVF